MNGQPATDDGSEPADLASALNAYADQTPRVASPEGVAPDASQPLPEAPWPSAAPDEVVALGPPLTAGGEPWVLHVVAGASAGAVVPVGRRRAVVGQTMGVLTLEDPFVSEGHAAFFLRGDALVVEDGGAASGVYLSVEERVILEPGHVFACGLQVFRYLGPLDEPLDPTAYGAPAPLRAFRLEQVLVGGRSGRVTVFRHGLSVGRTDGTLRFPGDDLLDPLHAELKPSREGMQLTTHSTRWPVFVRMPAWAEVPLQDGALVRIGTTTLHVVATQRG